MPSYDDTRKAWRLMADANAPGEKRRRVVRHRHDIPKRDRAAAVAAEQALRNELAARRESAYGAPGTFADLAAKWVNVNRGRWSPTTTDTTEQALAAHINPHIGHLAADRITALQIQTMYAAWEADGYAPPTRLRWHRIVRTIFGRAERWGAITWSPMGKVDATGGRALERMHMPTAAEVRKVIANAASPMAAVFFELAATTGARRGTLVALRWHNVNLDAATVTFTHAAIRSKAGDAIKATKANRPYTVALTPATVAVLRAHKLRATETALALGLGGTGYVFSSDGGTSPWSVQYPSHAWLYATRKAGVSCRLHDLRHFAASHMLAARMSAGEVAAVLGCTEANVITTYSHLVTTDGAERAAAAMAAVMAG